MDVEPYLKKKMFRGVKWCSSVGRKSKARFLLYFSNLTFFPWSKACILTFFSKKLSFIVADPSYFDVDPDPDPRIQLSGIVYPEPDQSTYFFSSSLK